jgi:signal transduction protein with GAF and PtsI domain
MSDEWTEVDDAVEEVRAVRRAISKEFDHDHRKYLEHLLEYQKQFADRLVTREQLDAMRAGETDAGKSAA